jgi:hypothetical protein
MLLIATLKLACTIFMALLIMASFMFFALLLRGGRTVEKEDERPCADYGADCYIEYSERPYIAKEQYN